MKHGQTLERNKPWNQYDVNCAGKYKFLSNDIKIERVLKEQGKIRLDYHPLFEK